MDSLENANTQTVIQQATDDKTMVANEVIAPPVKAEKPKQTYKCLVCGKSYSKKTSLFTHHKTHPEHCVHCGENRGSSVENIYEHNLKHVNIRPFVCKVCGDSFLRNQQFVEHEKSHLEKKPEDKDIPPATKEKDNKYKCKTCDLSYTNWKLFYKHQQESGHFNEKFLCEICGNDFHSNFLLSQHIRRLHKRTDESFPCTSCSKTFASKPNLDSHIKKIHQNDNTKTHRCETCNNLFSSAPNLKQHIKTVHEVEREYECQTCKKPFKAKNRLTRHEKEVHMGKNGNPEERMFNCDHCQKKYKRSWHQARHNQMKHENSNASTATTTSSIGTPPTPEINGNMTLPSANNINNNNNNNNTFNYQQQIHPLSTQLPPQNHHQQQQQQAPPQQHQQISQDINNIAATQPQQNQNIIPPASTQHQQNVWNHQHLSPQHQQQQHHSSQAQQQQHLNYGNEMIDTKNYGAPPPTISNVNGEYVHYAVNEQYSNKFDVQTAAAPPQVNQQVSYDSWNQSQQQQTTTTTWDYNQHHMQPMYHHHQQPQSHQPDWSTYYDPNQQHHHGMYNNTYNNYKTDYNCLNQPPTHIQPHHQNTDPSAMYNGGNYYYYPQTQVPDPYVNQLTPQSDYNTTNINHHQQQQQQHSNYQNNPM